MDRETALRFRRLIEQAAASQTDADALQSIELFPSWESKLNCSVVTGERYRYKNKLYKVVQDHHVQSDWTPDITPALYTAISIEEWPEWVQPTGAHDVYHLGDKVTHNNKHWLCSVDNNSWEPGVYGWAEI